MGDQRIETQATAEARPTGTFTVKRGLADMLRGGVIMDVVDADQAKVAEDAGAVAVMALERVPADIRRDGGVARMSDPALIEGIKAAVTVPVMAKARIGHFAEAQVLEALGVDYIDESEVLTPADEAHHIDKWAFTVPFVCGATNLGEALRRISEGAAMIRSKGEAGTGDIVEAVRHLRSILGRYPQDHPGRLGRAVRLGQAAGRAHRSGPGDRRHRAGCPCRCSAPAGSPRPPTPPWCMQLGAEAVFVGSGIFKSADPARLRPGHRGGDHPFQRRRDRGQGVHRAGRGHARRGDRHARRASGRARLVTAGIRSADRCLRDDRRRAGPAGRRPRARGCPRRLGAPARLVRRPGRPRRLAGMVLPGGESTTMSLLLESRALFDPLGCRPVGACRPSGPAPG